MPATPNGTASPFVSELQRLLASRDLSWRKLASLTGYHPSWLSKIRHGAPPSDDLVRRCDEALEAGGALVTLASVQGTQPPAQLPAPPAGYVGRQPELRRIFELLTSTSQAAAEAPRIVSIEGLPGAGKTATALRCAHDVTALRQECYPDGQLYANLQGYSPKGEPAQPEAVLEEFLIALGMATRDIPAGVERRAKLYRSLLATRKTLVVLDNVGSSAQIEPLLPGSPGCGVIATSRRTLAGLAMRHGAEHIELGPMTEPDAVAILDAAVGDGADQRQADLLATLADQCGRLPLALRIVAERLTLHPRRWIGDLVDELAAERERLEGLVVDDSPAVRTVFAWSYQDLSDAEARAFRLLSLHGSPHFGSEAAAAMLGVPVVRARRLLEKLVAVHLVEGHPDGRYGLHDLLRVYAADRVGEEDSQRDLTAAVRRLTDWYLCSAAAAGRRLAPFRVRSLILPSTADVSPVSFDDAHAALRWCDTEAENFAPVARLAMDWKLHDTVWKLSVALFDYLRLLRRPGCLWLDTTILALDATRTCGDRVAEGWVETSLAEGYRWIREYDRSLWLFNDALLVRREVGDRHGEAWALAGLGFLAIDCGRLDQAHQYALDALEIFREIGDRHGEASALLTLADTHHGRSRYDDALDALDGSLRIFTEIENHDGQALASAKLADVHLTQGEPQRALRLLDQSLHARRRAGSRWGEADGLVRRGRVLKVLGRLGEEKESLEAAIVLYEKVDDPQAGSIRAYLDDGVEEPMRDLLLPSGW